MWITEVRTMVEVGDKVFIRFASNYPYSQWSAIVGREGVVVYKCSSTIFVRIEDGGCAGGIPRQHTAIISLKEEDVLEVKEQ
jgi:hypothetical protein